MPSSPSTHRGFSTPATSSGFTTCAPWRPRRLRAALEIFEPCFPEKAYGQALTEVKRLADALGERRDRDVAIAALRNFNDQMAAPDRRGIGSLIEQLRGEQEKANEGLAPLVSEENLKALRESMDELVSGARAVPA